MQVATAPHVWQTDLYQKGVLLDSICVLRPTLCSQIDEVKLLVRGFKDQGWLKAGS